MYKELRSRAIDIIKSLLKKDMYSGQKVIDKLKERGYENLPTIQTIYNRRNNLVIDELNEDVQKKQNYVIKDDYIVLQKRATNLKGQSVTKEYKLPIDKIGEIVFDYSRYGHNLSGPDIIKKYEIKEEVWRLLKNRLNIYKSSNACPDIVLSYIENKYGEDALEEKIRKTSYRAIQSKYKDKYKKTYQEQFKKEAKKALKTMAKIDNFLEHIQEYIKDYQPVKLPDRVKEPENNVSVDVVFSDIHIGKRNTDSILDRINKLTNYILNQPESNVNLIFLGDLIEALVEGGMHPGQVEDMDSPYGFDLLVMTVDVIVDMVCKLHKHGKRVKFYGITGNHDRVTEKNGKNPERTAGLVIFEMIKRSLDNTDAVIKYYREEINSFDTELFHYVTAHKLSRKQKKAPEKILWNNGANSDKYNIVLYGHEHSISMSEGKNVTLIGVPALAGQGAFDKKLDLHSTAGALIVRKWNGLADILVKRFQ